jgi:hypothetical protein
MLPPSSHEFLPAVWAQKWDRLVFVAHRPYKSGKSVRLLFDSSRNLLPVAPLLMIFFNTIRKRLCHQAARLCLMSKLLTVDTLRLKKFLDISKWSVLANV